MCACGGGGGWGGVAVVGSSVENDIAGEEKLFQGQHGNITFRPPVRETLGRDWSWRGHRCITLIPPLILTHRLRIRAH